MTRLETLFTSRAARIGIVLVWLVLGGLGGSFAQRFQDVQKNEESSFLPGSSESVKELTLAKQFPSGERFAAITVVRRDGGLEPADLGAVERVRASLAAAPPVTGSHDVLARLSPDRTTAVLIVNLNPRGKEALLKSSVSEVETRMAPLRARGLTVKMSGPAGFSRDAVNVFSSINGTLLLATATLVFVLLILIYRSPIFWVIPLFSVLMAEAFSRFCGWAIAEAGVTVNGQSAGILPVLVFGAGTDYALLLVARYREELRRHERAVQAMRMALRRAGPAVFASGSTVILALLCLSLAEVNGTSGLGPIGAMGVALAMLAMLTLLPAAPGHRWTPGLLAVRPAVGRRGRGRDPRSLASGGRASGRPSAAGLGHDGTAARARLHRPHELLHWTDEHAGLPRHGSIRTGATVDRASVPGRGQRAHRRGGARRRRPAEGPARAARGARRGHGRAAGARPPRRALPGHPDRRPLLDHGDRPDPTPARGGARRQPDGARRRTDRAAEGLQRRGHTR